MDKLQELLKEYQLSKGEWVRLAGPEVEVNDKEELVLEATLISKKYGFIQWLVENDKIDLGNIPPIAITKGGGETAYNEPVMIIDRVLMLLSIQDEPIEFLVSILK